MNTSERNIIRLEASGTDSLFVVSFNTSRSETITLLRQKAPFSTEYRIFREYPGPKLFFNDSDYEVIDILERIEEYNKHGA